MNGRVLVATLLLAGCLDWEPVEDATSPDLPDAPPLRGLTPAGLPPMFDPGDAQARCRTICTRYLECFGPAVSLVTCRSACISESWAPDEDSMACYLASACSEMWLCREDG